MSSDLDASPVVLAAAELARELAADATRLEREGVDRPLLDRMSAVGLLAVAGPPALGGAWPAEQRRVAELLSGASPDAWFVWFQHGPVVKMLKASENTDLAAKHLPELCAGRELGGVAWSHLRTSAPSVHATRVEGGWSLSGTQPWCTGWGMTDLVLVGALVSGQDGTAADQVLFGLVPGGDRPEMAGKERAEEVVIAVYLPEQLTQDDVTAIVAAAVAQLDATGEGMKAMGKVMGVVQPQVKGRADGSLVAAEVRRQLG